NGLKDRFPRLSLEKREYYGVPMSQLPEPLRTHVQTILEWKVAPFAIGRPSRSRHRPVTAVELKRLFCRLFGFVRAVLGNEVTTLSELISEENVSRYTEWTINERKLRRSTLS